jgi:hypothetical protein
MTSISPSVVLFINAAALALGLSFSQVHAQTTPSQSPSTLPVTSSGDAGKEALAKKIVDSSDFDKVADRMKLSLLGQVEGMFGQQTGIVMSTALDSLLKSKKLSTEKHKQATKNMPKLAEVFFKQEVPKVLDSMKKAMDEVNIKSALYEGAVPFYVANFSQDELEKVLAFQSSPVGQKVLAQTPQLIDTMFPVIQKKLTAAIEPTLKSASSAQSMESYLVSALK